MAKPELKFAGVDRLRQQTGFPWRPWQPMMVQHVLGASHSIIQGVRQATGKSFVLSLILAAYILLGYRVLVAMPTLRQGGRVLVRETLKRLAPFEDALGTAMKRRISNALEVVWANGGALMALSTDDAARKGAQGYTFDVLCIDEAHETTREVVADVFFPLTSVAMQAGHGKIILLGVGGAMSSLIEEAKTLSNRSTGKRMFGEALKITDELIIQGDPSWEPEFANQQALLTKRQYDQMYRMLPLPMGKGNLVFEVLRREGRRKWNGGNIQNRIGVDVGRWNDSTVFCLERSAFGFADVAEFKVLDPMPLQEQVVELTTFAREHRVRPDDIAIEINGIGLGLWELAVHGVPGVMQAPLRGAQGIHLGYDLKHDVIDLMSSEARRAEYVVSDPDAFQTMQGLTFEVAYSRKEAALFKWDHSDEFSAAIMARASRLKVGRGS